ncbi:NUDIX domain-containing protein [Streptomyces sp. ACA25]|uniref:NUDIX domain-containing protein n=1 Tax=Streptomyces sp. ACA25 TaxID=3022596 RepID=UPI00230754B0|nr:NUDIX domain-containing protein [Streptomyces sp. ACA25]MDB1090034.1 NUDIX domain-containing protein [Streptomyces sp. ACA25]
MPADDAPAISGAAPDSHCAHCGGRLPAGAGWPRVCGRCGRSTYRNPLPVAVALLPVRPRSGPAGLVVVRRTIRPQRGELALPGGFIDHGELWQRAVARELAEETGITAREEEVRLADVLSSTDGHLLIFGLLAERDVTALPPSEPTDETEGWELLPAPVPLAFPLHTRAARNWFEGRYHRTGG